MKINFSIPGSASDSFNYFRKFSFAKAWNILLVVGSYLYSKYSGKAKHWGHPISVSIEPTTTCNLECPECPSGLRAFTRPTGNLTTELFDSIIDQIAQYTTYLTFYFQGEPFIHPKFLDMVKSASTKGIYTATSTNAHYLTQKKALETVKSGLDRLIISIDGTTQEVYEQYRKSGKLDKVIEGTKNIVQAKEQLNSRTPFVVFQFLVVQPNEHQIEEVKHLSKRLGVDQVVFKTAQIYDYKNGNNLIPTLDKYSRYKKNPNNTYSIKNTLTNHCWRLWQSCVITWDGKVVPCCFDKDATHQLGELKSTPFKEIWNGKKYQNFRSAVLRSRSEIDICANCSEGTKIWA